jgi:hypothetical protein
MFVRKLTPWPGCYFAPETGAESGADAGTGAGAADSGTGAGTGTEPGKAEEEKAEESAEQRFLRLADRYRNEAGQAAKKARELEARLREVEDAQKPELQRLAERAEQVPVLERERDDWKARAEAAEAALTAEVEARQKALPKEMLDLLPENATPAGQLEWIRKATAAAEKLRPGQLPPAGGRNPAMQPGSAAPTKEQQDAGARDYASRF